MPNEIIRPCTLWGQTFDACEVSGVQASYHVCSKTIYSITINFWNSYQIESPLIKEDEAYTSKKVRKELNHIHALIYEALNAPVLVTEEVLAGLPKDARILGRLVCFDEDEKPDHPDAEWQEIRFSFLSKEWLYGVRSLFSVTSTDNMMRWYIIKANGCPKTAKYLSQFYTDGRIQV